MVDLKKSICYNNKSRGGGLMNAFKFIKDPGYTYDLFFLFTLYFNKRYCLTDFINYSKSNEDTEYYNKILDDYLPIPEDLLPFFYLTDDKKNFITKFYYEPYKETFFDTYNLATVQVALTDYDQVIENVIKFYFKDVTDEEAHECKQSITAIDGLIKKSKYSGELKSLLYSFFIAPIPIIQKLSYELMSKEFLLSKQYENKSMLFSEIQKQLNIEQLSLELKKGKNQTVDIDSFDNVFVSMCLYNKNCVKTHYYNDRVLIILGVDYKEYIDYLITQNKLPELEAFGNAISERNRIDILDLMLGKDEITIKDIEQELGFTGTNAYYHLSLMIKAGMIKSRNQGRTVLYSINKNYFHVLCSMLSKYSEKEGKLNERMEKT